MSIGKLHLIPSPLGDNDPTDVIPMNVLSVACSLKCYIAEDIRTARRFLSKYGLKGHMDELEFHTLNEHSTQEEIQSLLELFDKGDVGLITDAGLPAVADPGAALVALCHKRGIKVLPYVGPSSLMLALMASGLNGQSFAFCGYIPAKTDERRCALKNIEKLSMSRNQSQIIIETPYRNDSLFDDMITYLSPSTRVCVAADITLETQFIRTLTVGEWRRCQGFSIGKRPCVFVLLG